MKISLYRYSMLIAAFSLLALSVFFFITYAGIVAAVSRSFDMSLFHRNTIRGLWLTFASQSLLFALLYFLVASRPRSVSREVIVICGLLQLVASILILWFSGSTIAAYLLAGAALFVLIGSVLWPTDEELDAEKLREAAGVTSATSPMNPPVKTTVTPAPPNDLL